MPFNSSFTHFSKETGHVSQGNGGQTSGFGSKKLTCWSGFDPSLHCVLASGGPYPAQNTNTERKIPCLISASALTLQESAEAVAKLLPCPESCHRALQTFRTAQCHRMSQDVTGTRTTESGRLWERLEVSNTLRLRVGGAGGVVKDHS